MACLAHSPRGWSGARAFLHALLAALAFEFCSRAETAAVGSLPPHARFQFEDGLIRLQEKPELRLNIKGGKLEAGDPLVLWPCSPQSHELFDISPDGLIKLQANPQFCLNAEGGASAGTRIVTWPCEHGGIRAEHEEFSLGADGRLRLKQQPKMCINIKGGLIQLGAEVVLWPCGSGAEPNELFTVQDGMIKVRANTTFHLNVAQGDLEKSAPVVVWACQAAAHEAFEATGDKRIRVKSRPELCLNAEGGVAMAKRIIAWPCAETPQANELFVYDKDRGVIFSVEDPALGFNAKGGSMHPGDELVLWPLEDKKEL